MRILHVADLHVGLLMNGISLVQDHEHILNEIIELIGQLNADALVIPGDIYDKSNPSSSSVSMVDKFLSAAAQTGVPVFVTSGNHDSPERIGYGSTLLSREGVYISPVFDGTIAHYTINDSYGPVTFWLIPFLKPATVRHFFPDAEISSWTDALATVISSCEIDTSQRNVALSHQFVTSADFDPMRDWLQDHPQDQARIPVGGVNNVDVSAYNPFDYVALGHIHHRQRVGRDGVWYSGSPLKFSTKDDEVRDEKTATLVELGPKEPEHQWAPVSCEAIPLKPLHDVRAIRGTLADLTSPQVVSAAPNDDYLRVTITDENPPMDALAQLYAVYPNVAQFLVDNTRTKAAGVGNAVADIEDRDPLDVFEEFFEKQNGQPLDDEQRIIVADELEKAQVR